jgi:uncharacterized protein YutE (UPF0331/DUF86 family)
MVLKREIILERLKELDTDLQELSRYRSKSPEELGASLSVRWTVERGLIAAANLIFDVADHILGGHFSVYPTTYEESLECLHTRGVIPGALYQKLKGLGGFRNILVHDYLRIDLGEVQRILIKAFEVFPAFSREILQWLKSIC